MPSITETAINIGINVVKKFFESPKLNDDQLISVGVAVGYFYNFLDPVSRVIRGDDFQLYKSPDDKEPQTFQSDQIKLQIVMPQRLDVYAFESCEKEFKTYNKGFIYLKENNRYYGINYCLSQLANQTEITIIDLARPLMSVKRYYEDIMKMDADETDPKWIKIQTAEVTVFRESLIRLQKRGYGALVNKLDFRERG